MLSSNVILVINYLTCIEDHWCNIIINKRINNLDSRMVSSLFICLMWWYVVVSLCCWGLSLFVWVMLFYIVDCWRSSFISIWLEIRRPITKKIVYEGFYCCLLYIADIAFCGLTLATYTFKFQIFPPNFLLTLVASLYFWLNEGL